MNYKLAKQLKDAGFKQRFYATTKFYTRKEERKVFGDQGIKETFEKADKWIKIPTLSELIDACGKDFYALTRDDEDLKWHAQKDRGDMGVEGLTPEEAVAKLWFKLHGNKDKTKN